jgi:hypothetical protein
MIKNTDAIYLSYPESIQVTLFSLQTIILNFDKNITTTVKYGMPFFVYKQKAFCYLWVHKKLKMPYIGFIMGNKMEHPKLLQEKRLKMKIYLVNQEQDMDIKEIKELVKSAMALLPIV